MTTPRNTGRRVGFPATADPQWTPAQRDRWDAARRIAEAEPGTPGEGGWTVERLPAPVGVWLAFSVMLAGSAPSTLFAVHEFADGSLPRFYLGLAGVVGSGVAAMVTGWHLAPADLDVRHAAAGPTGRPAPVGADPGA